MAGLANAMLVTRLEGEQRAVFYNDTEKAIHDADIVMTSLGGWAQVYTWQDPTEENDYYGGYVLYYEG